MLFYGFLGFIELLGFLDFLYFLGFLGLLGCLALFHYNLHRAVQLACDAVGAYRCDARDVEALAS